MLGMKVNYQEIRTFLTQQGECEWVSFPFINSHYLFVNELEKNGFIVMDGWDYTKDQMEQLRLEKEGLINDFSFGPGRNEGYCIEIRFTSGQILRVKTFAKETFDILYDWIIKKNRTEVA